MKKWLQNLSGVVIASVLAVALNGKAFAEEPKPEPPLVEIGTSVASTEAPASGAAAVGDASAAGFAAPEIQAASSPGSEVSVSSSDVSTSSSDVSTSGSDVSTSGSDASASGNDASASGSDAFASGSDAFASGSDASVSGSDTPAADTLTVVADVLVADTPAAGAPAASDMSAAAGDDTDGSSENPDATTDQVVAKRGLKAMASGSGMRGGAAPAGAGENNDTGENNDNGENNNSGENGDGDDSSVPDPKPDPVSMFNQVNESSYVLVNYSLTEALSADGDITIQAAGLNYIPELSVDGNINLIGTGILLVDKIEMTEGKEFSLQPNVAIYGADGGSVAVFLKRVEQTTDAQGNPCEIEYYELINGGVDGILDEEYTIPEGVTLVVPDNSRLVMQSVAVARHVLDDVETVYYSLSGERDILKQLPGYYSDSIGDHYEGNVVSHESTSPKLTIAEHAKLVVQQQAALVMNAVSRLHGGGYEPQIEVSGTLELNSDTGSGSVVVKNTGDLTGSGSFTGTTIDVDGGRTDPVTAIHTQTGAVVNLNGDRADLGVLTASGNSILTYRYGSSSIDTVDVDGCLMCYTNTTYGETKELSILNGISGGGRMELNSGVYILGENCKVTDGTFIGAGGTTASVYDYYLDENGNSNLSPSVNPRVETRSLSQNTNGGGSNGNSSGGSTSATSSDFTVVIPCILTKVVDQPDWWGRVTSTLVSANHDESLNLDYSCVTSDEVTYDSLIDSWKDTAYYTANYNETTIPRTPVVLLETEVNGVWSSVLMTGGLSDPKVLAENIKTIRIVTWGEAVTLGQGGGYITSTNTAYTGSGVLGGSGAGSVSGGTATSILTGTGLHVNDQTQQNSGSGSENTGNTTGNNTGNQTDDPGAAPLVAFVEQPEEPSPIWVEVVPEVSTAVDTPADTDTKDAAEPEAAPATTETTYVLLALEGEKTLDEMGGKASVSMSYTPPAEYEGKALYVVFRDENNNLVAIRAMYLDVTHLLQFITDRLGEFMVVGFDFDSTEFKEFSPEFYEALAKLPELENLLFSEVGAI